LSETGKGLSEKKLLILTLVLVIVIAAPVVALLLLEAPELGLGAAGRIAVIRIVGPLEFKGYSILGAVVDAKTYIELIEEALEDPSIRAVVIRVNSPGGDAAASEALYYAVKKLAENKTVVAYIEGLGASGAYEMLLPCDRIVAGESSIVGAVGVYTVVVNVEGLMEKLGVKVYVYKSGALKDLGSPFREPTSEEEEVFREIIEGMFETFKSRVLEHRGEVDGEVFTGRPFVARQALEAGLIDQVGTFDDAVEAARELAGLPKTAPVEELKPPVPTLFDLLRGGLSEGIRAIPGYKILSMWPPPIAILRS